jgi:eukaryotic-like serine/threonine-protein kinase
MAPEPTTVSRDDRLDEVIFDYFKALDAGETPDRQEILARHPDLADDLRRFFANQEQLNPFDTSLLPPIPSDAPPEDDLRSFGDYEVHAKIGSGGMGDVYKVKQISLKQLRALKIIKSDRAGAPADVQRFIREAEDVARLDHPNIVPIYDVQILDGKPYFTMKLMENGSLAARIDEFILPLVSRKTRKDKLGKVWTSSQLRRRQRNIASLVATMARAVHHAHQRGILHRDLKPGNVLLDAEKKPHVTDFGLAKRIEIGGNPIHAEFPNGRKAINVAGGDCIPPEAYPKADLQTERLAGPDASTLSMQGGVSLTVSGTVAGTPPYMAPEQAAGIRPLTTAVDVYGLGAILYELLTGRQPFRAGTPRETLQEVIDKEPVRPNSINPRVSSDLQAVCLKCLTKQPDGRYGSAEKLAEDLERFVNGRPVKARRVGPFTRVTMWMKRRPAIAGLTAALFLLTVLGGSVLVYEGLQTAEALEREQGQIYIKRINLAKQYIAAGRLVLAEDVLEECPPSLHDQWEWRYLKRLCQRDIVSLRGHSARVIALQFSPDGMLVATASENGETIIWDVRAGDILHTLPASPGAAESVCFSGDGKLLITAGWEEVVRVWQVSSGKLVRELPEPGIQVAASLKCNRVACVALDGEVTVRDLDDDSLVCRSRKHGQTHIICIALSPNGRYLAQSGYDRLLEIYDTQTDKSTSYTFPTGTPAGSNNVWSVAFSADGESFAAGSSFVCEWKLAGGEPSYYTGPGDRVCSSLSFSRDGQRIAANDRDGVIRVWDRTTCKTVGAPRKHSGMVAAVAFCPSEGSRLAVTRGNDVTIENISAAKYPPFRVLRGHQNINIETLLFHRDWTTLASRAGSEVILWDVISGKPTPLEPTAAVSPEPAGLAFLANGAVLVPESGGDRLQTWDKGTGHFSRYLDVQAPNIRCFTISDDYQFLAVADGSNQITVRELANNQQWKWDGGAGAITSLAFLPGKKRLASCRSDGFVMIWDVRTGEEIFRLEGHKGLVTRLAMSPTGPRMATGSADRTIRIWNTNNGKQVGPVLSSHTDYVSGLAYSPDGKRFASWSHDGTIKIWDAVSNQEVMTLTEHEGWVTGVEFSPDGHLLASCGRDGTIRIWDARPLED